MLKRLMLVVVSLLAIVIPATASTLISGAGATFPYPLYAKWFGEYAKIDKDVRFNYQAIGSGEGIRLITAQTVDFGASDKFLSDEELKAAPGKLLVADFRPPDLLEFHCGREGQDDGVGKGNEILRAVQKVQNPLHVGTHFVALVAQ